MDDAFVIPGFAATVHPLLKAPFAEIGSNILGYRDVSLRFDLQREKNCEFLNFIFWNFIFELFGTPSFRKKKFQKFSSKRSLPNLQFTFWIAPNFAFSRPWPVFQSMSRVVGHVCC